MRGSVSWQFCRSGCRVLVLRGLREASKNKFLEFRIERDCLRDGEEIFIAADGVGGECLCILARLSAESVGIAVERAEKIPHFLPLHGIGAGDEFRFLECHRIVQLVRFRFLVAGGVQDVAGRNGRGVVIAGGGFVFRCHLLERAGPSECSRHELRDRPEEKEVVIHEHEPLGDARIAARGAYFGDSVRELILESVDCRDVLDVSHPLRERLGDDEYLAVRKVFFERAQRKTYLVMLPFARLVAEYIYDVGVIILHIRF